MTQANPSIIENLAEHAPLPVKTFTSLYGQWLTGQQDNWKVHTTISSETKQSGGIVYTLRELNRQDETIFVLSCMTERALSSEAILKALRSFTKSVPVFVIQFVNIPNYMPNSTELSFEHGLAVLVNAAAQQLLVDVSSHNSYQGLIIDRLTPNELDNELCHMLKKNEQRNIPIMFLHDPVNRCYFYFPKTILRVQNVPLCGGAMYYIMETEKNK